MRRLVDGFVGTELEQLIQKNVAQVVIHDTISNELKKKECVKGSRKEELKKNRIEAEAVCVCLT